MYGKISSRQLFEDVIEFHSEEDVVLFFRDMKIEVCNSFLKKEVPVSQLNNVSGFERIYISILDSFVEKDDDFIYRGQFEVRGKISNTIYDTIEIELKNVSFLQSIVSIDDYISSMFLLRYTGCLASVEDILFYCRASGKSFENNRTLCLLSTHDSQQLFYLASLIKRKPFEVTFELHSTEQKYLYFYNDAEHLDYLKNLINRTKTHKVTIRIIDNEISEIFNISKGLNVTKIRKNHIKIV